MNRSHVSSFVVRVAHTRGGGLLYYVVPVWYSRVAWAKANMHTFVSLMNGPLPPGFPPVQAGGMRLSG